MSSGGFELVVHCTERNPYLERGLRFGRGFGLGVQAGGLAGNDGFQSSSDLLKTKKTDLSDQSSFLTSMYSNLVV